jgi:deoxyribodipyrimidine photolyase-related protein
MPRWQVKRILYLPFDQLHKEYGVLREANPESDLIVMVESQRMVTGKQWNKVRLYFLISAALHFAEALRADGFTVEYLQRPTTHDGLVDIARQYPGLPLVAAQASSYRLTQTLAENNVQIIPNDFFLTSRTDFALWAGKQKSFLMENFYRAQRVRLQVLVEGNSPVGGQWNFDKENRLPPPKNYTYPPYLHHEVDAIDREVANSLGIEVPDVWGTTRAGAQKQLQNFLDHHFGAFGPYEDAMTTENWALHHSLLSPYLNNGLLHPAEVLTAVLQRFEKGDIPIASAEGFIRQLIGWREYVNGMYWHFGPEYKEGNNLTATRKLLPLYADAGKTQMRCVQDNIQGIAVRGWVHHIPRLMVLSNLALIAGVNPQEYLQWMRESFIDASDWVMVPNVIGMGIHADGGAMMTKPYAAGGSYISKMSNYCKPCRYDPKKRVGEDACPFTTLYWDFLDRHREEFSGNHRMAQQLYGLDRLSDLPELRERAQEVLRGLERGEI